MITYLLKTIPRLLFESIAVTAVLGIAAALYRFRKKRGMLFHTIFSTILFMLVWRLSVHRLMLSSRYAFILILPAVILTVWFCFQLKTICRWFLLSKWFAAVPCKRIVCRAIPWLCVIGIFISCLIKDLRYNSYHGHVQDVCRAFLADSQDKSPVYLYSPQEYEQTRIAYFCGRKNFNDVIPFQSANPVNVTPEELRERVKLTANIPGTHYFFIQQEAPAPILTTQNLALPGDAESWKEVKRVFTSRRRNREMILYRYDAPCLNIHEIQGKIPVQAPGNLCPNGGFEKALPEKAQNDRKHYYQKNGIPLYQDEKFLLPDCWWLALQKEAPPAIFMNDVNPIAGRYSLSYDTRRAQSPSRINALFFPAVQGTYSLLARGEGDSDSTLAVSFLYKNQKTGAVFCPETLLFHIQPAKLCHIHGKLPETGRFQANTMTAAIEVRSGALSLDQVEIIPAHQGRK